MSVTCVCCERPVSAGFLCRDGVRKLESHLRSVPALVEALEEAVTRQVRFAPAAGGSGEVPLAFNSSASDALTTLRVYLEGWAGRLADRVADPVRWPGASQSAAFIVSHRGLWQRWDDVGAFYEGFAEVRAAAWVAVDRPPEPVYLGRCNVLVFVGAGPDQQLVSCPEILWAYDDNPIATCKRCESAHVRADREADISDRVRAGMVDRIMTATDAAEVLIAERLASGDVDKLADRIRKWGALRPPRVGFGPPARGALIARAELQAPGKRSRPGYRLGDVIDLLAAAEARRAQTPKKEKNVTEIPDYSKILTVGTEVRFDGLTRTWVVRAVSKDGRFAIAAADVSGSVEHTLIDHVELSRTVLTSTSNSMRALRARVQEIAEAGAFVGPGRVALFVTGVKLVGAKAWSE